MSSGQQYYDQQQAYNPAASQHSQQYDMTSSVGGDGEYTEALPEVLYLMQYCAQAFPPIDDSEEARVAADLSWNSVREWIQTHSPEEFREAAEQRDDVHKTALHFACQQQPPIDIIDSFLNVAADTVQWPDSNEYLPIHYACAFGAEAQVIKNLAEAYPESKTTVDKRGRTPLHFFLGIQAQNSDSPDIVALLSNTGAASYPTEEGILPLHLACAYGRSEETLIVLTDAYPDAAVTNDNRLRTPLHFVLSNAGRRNAPAAVRMLLSRNPELVNAIGDGNLPLFVLAQFASSGVNKKDSEQIEAVQGCLKHLLSSSPEATPEFFTALQKLPNFLQEKAVVMKEVQELLNYKISQRFPTLILLLDFVMQILVLVAYVVAVTESLTRRYDPNNTKPIAVLDSAVPNDWLWVGILYLGAFYFLVREIVQGISLVSLGAFRIYIQDVSNWINILYIGLLVMWATLIMFGGSSNLFFRSGTSLSVLILFLNLLAYLRNVYIDFAIFASGVGNVANSLGAFIFCLLIFLVCFSRMFYTLFIGTEYCSSESGLYHEWKDYDETSEGYTEIIEGIICQDNRYDARPWCDNWHSFLSIYI